MEYFSVAVLNSVGCWLMHAQNLLRRHEKMEQNKIYFHNGSLWLREEREIYLFASVVSGKYEYYRASMKYLVENVNYIEAEQDQRMS